MSQLTYEASVYSRTVKYTNFKGKTSEEELFFALDPLALMQFIAGFQPKTNKKSGDPRKRNEVAAISDADQIKMVRDLACKAAGFPSEDGEFWEPFEKFDESIAGKAFLTKLVSSDADRKEFSEKVILDPFRAFVGYAEADSSNTQQEVQQMKQMLTQLENVFSDAGAKPNETLEERKARLQAELQALTDTPDA